jgi:hypothetical protein
MPMETKSLKHARMKIEPSSGRERERERERESEKKGGRNFLQLC